jgi:DNA repair photolyase
MVKRDAPQLLRAALASPGYRPATISISGVTDCYQPVERSLRITRGCLEVLGECRHPVALVTKNHLVTRDVDLLAGLAQHNAACVILSVTSLDPALQRVMEPRTSSPARRLEAIEKLVGAGIPTGVLVAPIVPGLTDHETPAILKAVAAAGACFAGYVPLRLPFALAPMFERWLEQHFPDRKEKVLNRIRSMRGGKLNDGRFGSRMRGEGIFAEQMKTMFELARRKAGIPEEGPKLSTDSFRPPRAPQMTLWE